MVGRSRNTGESGADDASKAASAKPAAPRVRKPRSTTPRSRSTEAPTSAPAAPAQEAARQGSEQAMSPPLLTNQEGLLTEHDVYLFREGTHGRLAHKFGAHPAVEDGVEGCRFAVWAPDAMSVSVIGDFNDWDPARHRLHSRPDGSGIWQGFIPAVGRGACYKYRIVSRHGEAQFDKGDPYALAWESPPRTASRVWDLNYAWNDDAWMTARTDANGLQSPWSIYEVHLGSWRRVPEEGNRSLTYRELAERLPAYVKQMGFTHVELLPVSEHPFYGSWGYQCTGYFAPTARYGEPEDFMALVDALHQAGIGVILDWVPSHFPDDPHGLAAFDGSKLYEHADPRQGYHPEWNSVLFNYGRHEVRAFLISSALFWLETYHADALRVDAVASMLYLDYGRKDGEWIPNRQGGKENLDAIQFLHQLNQGVYRDHGDTQTIAEESTAWPMVSRPVDVGGLGFGMKWNMGWMHDTLRYFQHDPIHRRHHHDELTFSLVYAFHENFVLPLSHDEVVYGKGSLIGKMPGDPGNDNWQRFANLRLLYGYMWTHPGKKLLFMGGEFAQWSEWHHDTSLEWHLLEHPRHRGIQRWIEDLNRYYREQPALYEEDFSPTGFEWIDNGDRDHSVLSYLRRGRNPDRQALVVCNFTPVPRTDYRVGVPQGGRWREALNSDADVYGGSGMGNGGGTDAVPEPWQGRDQFLNLTLPPLATVIFEPM